MTSPEAAAEVGNHLSEIEAEVQALRAENARLRDLLGLDERAPRPRAAGPAQPTLVAANDEPTPEPNYVTQRSSAGEKIALFRSLFIGRDDIHARAWSSQGTGKSGWSPAVRGGRANSRAANREYVPYDDEVVERHLAGEIHAGIYPLLMGDTCRLLACDFDGAGGALDALATSMPPTAWAFPPCWNGHDRGTVDTSGSFSAGTSERRQPGDSACTWSGRR